MPNPIRFTFPHSSSKLIMKPLIEGEISLNLNQWFEKGISKEAYMNDLDKHLDDFHAVYNRFEVPEKDQTTLKNKSGMRVIALAEVWCGHCMMNVPILLHMLETANIPVSFLPRDKHLELMDQYLTKNKRFIPIFIFIDESGNEIGKWGPMAPEVEALSDQMKEMLPSKDDPNYKAIFTQYADKVGKLFTNDDTYWVPTYESILKAMP